MESRVVRIMQANFCNDAEVTQPQASSPIIHEREIVGQNCGQIVGHSWEFCQTSLGLGDTWKNMSMIAIC